LTSLFRKAYNLILPFEPLFSQAILRPLDVSQKWLEPSRRQRNRPVDDQPSSLLAKKLRMVGREEKLCRGKEAKPCLGRERKQRLGESYLQSKLESPLESVLG
jgi:hypothetical protein